MLNIMLVCMYKDERSSEYQVCSALGISIEKKPVIIDVREGEALSYIPFLSFPYLSSSYSSAGL